MDLNKDSSWGGLETDPNYEQLEKNQKALYEENIHFLKVFSTPSGKLVLDWMVKHTLDTPTWWPLADYDKAIANGFWREGQNNFVRQIKSKIQQAKNYQEKKK